MVDRPWWSSDPEGGCGPEGEAEHGSCVPLYDPGALAGAIGDGDDGYFGPGDERPETPRSTEDDVRARRLRRILRDPRGAMRPSLHGTPSMASRLAMATATMVHFHDVTGVIERAVLQSHHTGLPLAMPPILMVSGPGLGKTHYCRRVAEALRTTCIPIAINGISERGGLGGLSTAWRGARPGRLARGLLVESVTAAPLFLLDEIDKAPALIAGENTLDVLLSALEPENGRAFIDEYIDVPIDLSASLWLASANDVSAIPTPLLDRMLVVDVPWPDRAGARMLAEAVAADVLERRGFEAVAHGALEPILHLAPRRMRCALELGCGFAAARRRSTVTREDVDDALALVARDSRCVGFFAAPCGHVL